MKKREQLFKTGSRENFSLMDATDYFKALRVEGSLNIPISNQASRYKRENTGEHLPFNFKRQEARGGRRDGAESILAL